MALINRISRLFQADMHAVLDRMEEPEALLKQAVREMTENVNNEEQHCKLMHKEMQHLDERLKDIDQTLAKIKSELDVCFASEKDELARSLIKRKLETQLFRKTITRKRDGLANQISELNQRLQDNRLRLAAMQQKLELLTENTHNDYNDDYDLAADIHVRDEEVEVDFLREKQKRIQA
jgi:phage shock protein A